MAKKKSTAKPASVPVEAHKHVVDKRPNIPTRETAAFAPENGAPPFVVHRDRSLDPQLVWKGKDEQDARPLACLRAAVSTDTTTWLPRDRPPRGQSGLSLTDTNTILGRTITGRQR
jgi:hypothetical protein